MEGSVNQPNTFKRNTKLLTATVISLCALLTSCKKETDTAVNITIPGSLMPHKNMNEAKSQRLDQFSHRGPQVKEGPLPYQVPKDIAKSSYDPSLTLSGPSMDMSLSQMPLSTFIKTVFGDYLKLTIELDPEIAGRKDLVTARTGAKKTPKEIYNIAKQIVNSYGVQLQASKNLIKFVPNQALENAMPQILYSRTGPDVPEDLRPIFQIVDIHHVDKNIIKTYLDQAFPGKGTMTLATEANAIIISGAPDIIRSAVEAIKTFDRPSFASRKSIRINLNYLTAENLTTKLLDILKTEGYFASDDPEKKTSITLLPVAQLNSIFVFAPDHPAISHILSWVKELDVPSAGDPEGSFYYIPIKNTDAKEIGDILDQVLAKQSLSSLTRFGGGARNKRDKKKSPSSSRQQGGKIVVNEGANALIFRGTAEEYSRILPLVQQMDVGARQVLIEVIVADYTYNENEQRGLDWISKQTSYYRNGSGNIAPLNSFRLSQNDTGINLTDGISPVSSSIMQGLNFVMFNKAGARNFIINLFNNTSKTTVLSTPRVLTKSGGESEFKIGQRIPTFATRSTASQVVQNSTTPLVQDIKYEDTGVLLTVKPTVHAGRRVDLEVRQTVSDVSVDSFGSTGSPSFTNTDLKTKLSLRDGASVLLGGFIKDKKSTGRSGVPVLKKIPVLGSLFRRDNDSNQKQETLLLITPYIIDNDNDAAAVTEAFQQRFTWINQ
jgi:general secretion pathway protein D